MHLSQWRPSCIFPNSVNNSDARLSCGLFRLLGCDETMKGEKYSGYRGCQTKTRSGRTCQRWSSQSPHKHSMSPSKRPGQGLEDNNYCRLPLLQPLSASPFLFVVLTPTAWRNPNGEKTIWCYTTYSGTRWEYCNPLTPTAWRNSDGGKTMWCYTTETSPDSSTVGNSRWEYCNTASEGMYSSLSRLLCHHCPHGGMNLPALFACIHPRSLCL